MMVVEARQSRVEQRTDRRRAFRNVYLAAHAQMNAIEVNVGKYGKADGVTSEERVLVCVRNTSAREGI